MVEVVSGVIKTKVHIDDLYLDTTPEKKRDANPYKKTISKVVTSTSRDSSMEINLLGMTVDDAVLEVDRFIDNAVMRHLNQIYIIHGKGTGALRSGIQTHLKKHPSVRSYRLGTYGEGDSGVTVVELK